MAPRISNPRKQFRFSIEILSPNIGGSVSLQPYLVQEVTHPESTIEQDTHGDVNYDVKTAGKITTGNATVNKILTTSDQDSFMWDWHEACQRAGQGGFVPSDYKMNITVREFGEGEDETKILDIWRWEGCWPTKINGQTNTRQESGNTIESVEFSIDRVRKNDLG